MTTSRKAAASRSNSLFEEVASMLPEDDKIALSGLFDANAQRAWSLSRISEYKERIRILISLHNTISILHSFPTEILLHIFKIYSWDKSQSAATMLAVSHVCHRWRAVLLAMPEYWAPATVHATDNRIELLKLFLSRSSLVSVLPPLDIIYDKKILKAYQPHLRQLRGIAVSCSYEDRDDCDDVDEDEYQDYQMRDLIMSFFLTIRLYG